MKFVDMAHTPKEQKEELSPAAPSIYPYGLCLCLGQDELEKLDLEEGFSIGDLIDMRCLAKVTSVSMSENSDGVYKRVELQITHMAVENEDEEDEKPKLGRRNPYK